MGEKTSSGAISWEKVARLLPHKTVQQVMEYSRLFEYYLAQAEPNTHLLPGNVPVQSVFMDKRPRDVRGFHIKKLL